MHSVKKWYFYSTEDLDLDYRLQEISWLNAFSYTILPTLLFSFFVILFLETGI